MKPAPKIVASLVNELIVSCPRGCGVDVERGCLKGHLKGTCELEILTCSCGESMTRRDLQHVRETERWEVDDQVPQPNTGCIHEWQQCPHCSGSYQRLHKTVLPQTLHSNCLNRITYKLVLINNHPANTVELSFQIAHSKLTTKHALHSHSPVHTPH